MCPVAKRLERGRFLWPSAADGAVTISTAQLGLCSRGSTGECRGKPGVQRRPREYFAYKPARLTIPSSLEVTNAFDSLPSDLVTAHALILAERAARREPGPARAARAEADLSHTHTTALGAGALIARLRLEIAGLPVL